MHALLRVLPIAVLYTLSACNPTRQELQQSHDAPGGEYRVHYQDPPWTLIETDGAFLRLEVEANGVRFGGIDATVIPPKYLLEVSAPNGTAANRITEAERQAQRDGDEIIAAPAELTTAVGVVGWTLTTTRLTSDGTRFRRFVYLDRSGGVVHLYFEANNDLQNLEVDAMIEDVVVDPE